MRARWLVSSLAALLIASGVVVAVVALGHGGGPPQPMALTPGHSSPISPPASPARVVSAALPPSRPDRLDIPAIGVHASIGSVGLTGSGVMEVPKAPHYDEPAWYRYSPTPGAIGPSIIVGHVDSKGGPSVFFRLGALRVGDAVVVHRVDGTVATFVVRSVHRYPKTTFPSSAVYGDTSGSELRLITCGGSFDRSSGHYRDNVVVFAAIVS